MENSMKILTFEEITEKHKRQAQQFLDEHPPKEGSEAPLEFWLINRGLRIIEQAEAKISHYKNNRDKYADSCMYLSKQCDKLQAENERYLHSIKLLEKDVAEAKAEAVKEFAERLKKCGLIEVQTGWNVINADCEDIDSLVKEMVGEENEAG